MKTIKKIFLTDIIGLIKNPFCMIIVVGACFLAALYAWANIFSNWDPYGNTGNLKMAAVSLDKGYTTDEGEYENAGDELITELHDNDKIDWQFVEDANDAIAGVEDGTYYGAIVVSEDFTYDMYNVFLEDVHKPVLTFYQNQKINPVATKISDTVVETIQNNINEEFVETMTKTVFADANDLSDEIEEEGGIDGFVDKLKRVRDELNSYVNTIDAAIIGNDVLSRAAGSASSDTSHMQQQSQKAGDSLHQTAESLSSTRTTLNSYFDRVNITLDTISTTLSNMEKKLESAKLSNDVNAMADAVEECVDDTTILISDFDALNQALNAQLSSDSDNEEVKLAIATVNSLSSEILSLQTRLNNNSAKKVNGAKDNVTDAEKLASEEISSILDKIVSAQKNVNENLNPQMARTMKSLEQVVNNAGNLMDQMSDILTGMDGVFASLNETVDAANRSLSDSKETIRMLSDRLSDTIEKVDDASDDEKVQILMDTLSGDPDKYAEFFSEPVQINTEKIYPVENYGSAVTPFYTVLAIWVGALILTAILRTAPDKSRYPEAKAYERYFGRYATFFAFGQFQALIIVLGDLYILHVQCLHPIYFWLASAITSLTFSILIFSLVLAFGDVGKALAVVIVVLQIAGSSGTYPIELLPEFFQKLYIFFPFPYAINAMRECVAGMYGYSFLVYLLQLSIFIVISLAIGLWIRKPFSKLNHFMEERMEETGIL